MKDKKPEVAIPDAPEAPIHYDHPSASAWESGWQSGYEAAIADMAKANNENQGPK